MSEYNWAQNRSKLERAINELKEQDKPVTNEAVKAVYVRLLGVVVEEKEEEEVKEKKVKPKK